MANNYSNQLSKLSELTDKLALEIVFVEPGKDNGLLPINSLLSEIEEIVQNLELPEQAKTALTIGRKRIDKIFETTGVFDTQSISWLDQWVKWLNKCWDNLELGSEPPPLPDNFTENETQTISNPNPDTPANQPGSSKSATQDHANPDELPLIIDLTQDQELLREFINESHEHLQNIELGVLKLEETPNDAETLNSIFRAFHTFKGGSGLFNLLPINKLAHELENLLDLARQGKLLITPKIIDLILSGGDTLKKFISAISIILEKQEQKEPVIIPTANLIKRVHEVIVNPQLAESISDTQPGLSKKHQEPSTPPESKISDPKTETKVSETNSAYSETIKISTQKLDSLIDLVGEMVIAQSMVQQSPELNSMQDSMLVRNLAQLNRITGELQRVAISLRMISVQNTFRKMVRLVRDLAIKQQKKIDLVIYGEDTELDRTIIEQINDPLVHMIRNAVDHGIETPQERIKKGKKPEGTITLNAFHRGGNIVIEVSDDGAGIDPEKIRKKAIEKNLISPKQELSKNELLKLIFEPGFSTATIVTDISGRGVGMDVVKKNIEKLRGKIEIETQVGTGSKFSIILPLTLAIIDGLVVGVNGTRFIIPSLMVREAFKFDESMIRTVQGKGEMINVRNKLIPLIRFNKLVSQEQSDVHSDEEAFIVLDSGHQSCCLLVDKLIGKQEVVVKSLGEIFRSNPIFAGGAIMGDGRVGLILDVDALIRTKAVN